jgi:phytoene dehydrogenase-like protein
MKNENGKIDKNATVVIVGAGPAGLSTAWFLSKNGFHNVTVLEKLGRVGGLCKSLTVDGISYDLGANYVTWAYQETLKIAIDVGASTYPEKPYTSIELSDDGTKFTYDLFLRRFFMTLIPKKKSRSFRSSSRPFDILPFAGS